MEEWKSYKLSEICDLIPGFAFKSTDFGEFSTKAIKIGDIQPPYVNRLSMSGVNINVYDKKKLLKFLVKRGDFVLAMTGATIGKIGRYIDDEPAYLNQRVLLFRPHDNVNPHFIYYSLLSPLFQKYIINHIDSETAQPNISSRSVSGYEIALPCKKNQDRIASILSSIDEKIELNVRINHNLEDCLFSLYIHLLDSQCGSSTIGQVSERVYSGGTPDTKINDYWGGAIHWLSSGETSERFIIDTEKKITENGFRHSSTKFASKYDVVIASAGQGNTRGQTSMTLLDTCINQSVIVIHADSYEAPIIFCSLANRYDELRAISDASSIRGSLTTKMISALEIPIFPEIEAIKFSSQAKYIIDQIENNLKENYNLKVQRDTLLPKLMSGELCE